jgi:ferredoxin
MFAVGAAVKLRLLTDAIGAGRQAAQAITDMLAGKRPRSGARQIVDYARIKLAYFDPRLTRFDDVAQCGEQCSSCGTCRDCGICVAICPEGAISRKGDDNEAFEMVVDPERCIGCGFCAGACPCGIWTLVENEPLG